MTCARLDTARLRSVPVASVSSTLAPTLSRHWAARQAVLSTSFRWDNHRLLARRTSHCKQGDAHGISRT